jgi:hypothetical protein
MPAPVGFNDPATTALFPWEPNVNDFVKPTPPNAAPAAVLRPTGLFARLWQWVTVCPLWAGGDKNSCQKATLDLATDSKHVECDGKISGEAAMVVRAERAPDDDFYRYVWGAKYLTDARFNSTALCHPEERTIFLDCLRDFKGDEIEFTKLPNTKDRLELVKAGRDKDLRDRLNKVWNAMFALWPDAEYCVNYLFSQHPLLESHRPIDVVIAAPGGDDAVIRLINRTKFSSAA